MLRSNLKWSPSLSRRQIVDLLAVHNEVSRVLAQAQTVEEMLSQVLASFCGQFRWEFGSYWKLEPGDVLRCVTTWQSPAAALDDFIKLSRELSFKRGVGLPGTAWQNGRPTWVKDFANESFPRSPLAKKIGLHGSISFPIGRADRADELLGVLEFFSRRIRKPSATFLRSMETLSEQIGQAIKRLETVEAIRSSEARKSAIVQTALDCIIDMNQEGLVTEFNPAAEKTFGYTREQAIGRPLAELIIPPELRGQHRKGLKHYLETGESHILNRRLELEAVRADGSRFPTELAISRIDLPGPATFTGHLRDITERKRLEFRMDFLAEATAVLSSSLNYEETLQNIARLVVPRLADWCAVEVLEGDGSIKRMAVAHSDPAKEELVRELGVRYPSLIDDPEGSGKVIRTGEPSLLREIGEEMLRAVCHDETHFEIVRELGLRSAVVVPLRTRRGVVGTLGLAMAESNRVFDESDLGFVEDLAGRAAIAAENARLYGEHRRISSTLQHSLIPPELPQVPGVEIATCFIPAGEINEIGGDFYDLFQTEPHSWSVVIGDVCGKGAEAAAMTALARYTLRAVAMKETEPDRLLGELNQAILNQRSDYRFCTAICGQLQTGNGAVKLTLACGGHPLPLLLTPEGTVTSIGSPGTLLGVVPDPNLHRDTVELTSGDTVLFYTDGATDMRSPVGMRELDLETLLASHVGQPANQIAYDLSETVLNAQESKLRDDLALMVLRVK